MHKTRPPWLRFITAPGDGGGAGTDPAPNEGTEPKDGMAPAGDAEKTLASERTARSAAEKRAKELEDELEKSRTANLTDSEKTENRLAALEKELAAEKASNLRSQVALKHGLSAEDAELLRDVAGAEAMERIAVRLAQQAETGAGRNIARRIGNQPTKTAADNEERAAVRELFGSAN